ncbi:MAG: helix-turn-helix domain-containing protein [Solirubrobacteraceae bacterium]
MLRTTAMLEGDQTARLVSTGLDALDAVLGGLYWGDNVVWQLDSAPVAPFYAAIAARDEQFDMRLYIALSRPAQAPDVPGITVIHAGPDTDLAHPADLLREIHRRCRPGGQRLLLFESLDTMAQAWGIGSTQGFFARCCPLLLNVGAIAYWSMSARDSPEALRETVQSVTQCILRVDERSVRVTKAEGRPQGARGSVLHWYDDDGRPALEPADVIARVAASLRALRRTRELSQHDLAKLAGVTASAISQAERSERGLSLATLARLSAAVGVTIDDLLHGEDPEIYRIGRRTDDPRHHLDQAITLLGDAASEVRVDLVRLDPREAGTPIEPRLGRGIVAVASGLVQVQIAGQTPAVRAGEVLVADSERVAGWRNIGQTEAILFWIVASLPRGQEQSRSGGLG